MAAFPSYIVELQSSSEDVAGGAHVTTATTNAATNNNNNANNATTTNTATAAPERMLETEMSYSRSAPQLNMSTSAKRGVAIPRCPPRPQPGNALATSSSSPRRVASRVVSGQVTTNTSLTEYPEPRDRALQMLFTYPIMKVANTAFENGLRVTHRSSQNQFARLHNMHANSNNNNNNNNGGGGVGGAMENWSLNNASMTFDAATLNNSMTLDMSTFLDMSLTLRNLNEEGAANSATNENATAKLRGENVVRTATVLKRGAMWQTVLVIALAQRMWLRRFRVERLCRILRIYLLPVLLRRREESGSVLPDELLQRRAGGGQQSGPHDGTGAGGGPNVADLQQLHGMYLKEHHAFLAQLNNSAFLQLLAETMHRQRYMPGEVIARHDTPSQQRLYFIISGKCEVTPEPMGPHEGKALCNGNGVAVPSSSSASTPPIAANVEGSAAAHAAPLSLSRPRKQILLSGDCFGGIFRADTLFGSTYKALTQCIVWTLEAEDFERVFRAVADEAMLEHYTERFRALHLDLLRQRYPIAAVLSRVPVYRLLDNALERYANDFTAVVKVRGEVLFEQGDSPTRLYCLVEGSVVRSVRGHDGSYATGASQLLTTNGFANFNIRNRFVLLGEEPFILPCQQRYRCTVQSRAALLFSIPGDRFVGALLDDPVLYVALREKLTQQIQAGMRLDKSCLTHTAMLRAFPEAALQVLAAAAEPRVVHRSIAICEPVRQLKEVYLVVRGEVRDARLYSRRPSLPLATPSTSDADGLDDDDEDGHEGRNRGFVPRLPLPGHITNTTTNPAGNGKAGRHVGAAMTAAAGTNAHHTSQPGGGNNATTNTALGAAGQLGKGKAGRTATGAAAGQQQQQQTSTGNGRGEGRAKRSSQQSDQTSEQMEHLNAAWHNLRGDANGAGRNASNVTQPWQLALLDATETSLAAPLLPPPTTTSSAAAVPHTSSQRTPNEGMPSAAATPSAAAPGHRGSDVIVSGNNNNNGCGELPCVSPDEQQELNPPLPPCPDTHFRYSLGASWAGLLVDKWPNGWEAVTLVEMWAIPTVQLRMQFNNCTKAVQNVILAAARQAQKEALGLPAIQVAKLPPMKSYLPPEGTVAAVSARDEGSTPSSSRGRGTSRGGSSNNNTTMTTSKRLTSRANAATHSLASTTSPRTAKTLGSLNATRSTGNALEENSLSGEQQVRSPRGASLTGATAHTAVFFGGPGNATTNATSEAFANANSANYKSLSSEGRFASADRPVSAERDLSRSPTRHRASRAQKAAAAVANEPAGKKAKGWQGNEGNVISTTTIGGGGAAAMMRQRPGSRADKSAMMRHTATDKAAPGPRRAASRGKGHARLAAQPGAGHKATALPPRSNASSRDASRQPGSALHTPRSDVAAAAADNTNGGSMSDAIWAIRVAASYNGEFKEKELALNNIVREPAPLPALPAHAHAHARGGGGDRYVHLFGKTKKQSRVSPSPRARRGSLEPSMTDTAAAAWPIAGPAERQWFHETLFSSATATMREAPHETLASHNATTASSRSRRRDSVPHHRHDLCVLTGLPTAEDQAHGHVLEGQTSYFAAALVARQRAPPHDRIAGKAGAQAEATLPHLPSRMEDGTLGRIRSALPQPPRIPTTLPKRHAIVM